MKKLFLIVAVALSCIKGFAQDILTKTNGDKVAVKVIEVSDTDIKFKMFDNQNGPLYSLSRTEVYSVHYINGTMDVFNGQPAIHPQQNNVEIAPATPLPGAGMQDPYMNGRTDAEKYYYGYKGAATATLVVSLLSPLAGLIPAVACSATPPKDANLEMPNAAKAKQPDYYTGYRVQAKRIKSHKVWINYAIGVAVDIVFALVLLQGH